MSDGRKKKPVVPRLRFPEFRDEGAWEVKRLGEVVEITGGGTPSKKNQDFWSGNIPWVSSSDISEDSVKDIQITRFITPEAIKKSATKLVPKNSILLVSRVGVGKLAVTRQKICTSQDFTNLTPRKYDALFLAYYLKSISHVFESFNQGMAIQGFTKEDVESLEFALPNLESGEQQKIADCLSSLDELIELEARQCEALRQHKKGLMQQLFPREGETTPRLRFPEFRDAGAWEVKRLGKISEVVRGGSPRPISQFLTDKKEGVNWLKIGDILEGAKYVVATQEKIKPSGSTKTREVLPGDLILSNSMSFGRPYIMRIKACIHDGWLAITRISELQTNEFLYYFIMSGPAQQYLHDAAAGGGVRNLNADIVKLLPVSIPSEAKEQQKIADCLSSLDELIELQSQKVEALKQHKKGLMQQLFPQEVA